MISTSSFVIFLTESLSMTGQKALVLSKRLNQENLKDLQNLLISIKPSPPAFSLRQASFLLSLSGFLSHRNV